MTHYRKKPVEIDAMRWTGNNITQIWDWGGAGGIAEPWPIGDTSIKLLTIDGVWVPCPAGHWVIREPVPDRFYPCDPAVFADRYEPVDADGAFDTTPAPAAT